MSSDPYVVSELQYTAPMDVEPEFYLYEPADGTVKHEPIPDRRAVRIHDVRGRKGAITFDADGFEYIDIDVEVAAFSDPDDVKARYYPAVAEHVKRAVGAAEVHVFDHNFRSHSVTNPGTSDRLPVVWVHNDYTEKSAPRRIRELLPDRADELLAKRYCFINLWRPVTRPVEESPLAICSATSVEQSDFVTLALRYEDRDGQVYFARHNPNHQWHYLSGMRPDESVLLKCFDSAEDGRCRYTMHSAFVDPTSAADAIPRESIEARTIAFFD